MKQSRKMAMGVLACCIAAAAFGEDMSKSVPKGWIEDFEAAKKQAAAEDKLLLVDFSGSDWCGWCKRLDREVFAKPEFLKGVKNDFVLVMIDSPSDESILSKMAAEQNPKLQRQYKVSGYPTVLIMDAEGEVLDRTGYREGGPKKYVKYLLDVKKFARAIVGMKREIASLPKGDPARLAKIDAVFASADKEVLRKNESFIEELIQNDPDGKYAAKYPFAKYCLPLEKKFEKACNELQGRFYKKINEISRKGERPTPKQRAAVMAEVDAEAMELLGGVQKEIAAAKASAPNGAKADIGELEKKIDAIVKRLKSRKK